MRFYPLMNGYIDNMSLPISSNFNNYPSARRIVEELFHVAPPKPDKHTNQLMLEFAHFIALDISATKNNLTDSFSIPCDGQMKDFIFCPVAGMIPEGKGVPDYHKIEFYRALHDQSSLPRASINGQTSFLDLSCMYGITEEESKKHVMVNFLH